MGDDVRVINPTHPALLPSSPEKNPDTQRESFPLGSAYRMRATIAPLLGLSSLQFHNHLITAFSDRLFGGGLLVEHFTET
ncbi:uncharacterized [Tachysurus ichikawai]